MLIYVVSNRWSEMALLRRQHVRKDMKEMIEWPTQTSGEQPPKQRNSKRKVLRWECGLHVGGTSRPVWLEQNEL